jgi:hypothetical protein
MITFGKSVNYHPNGILATKCLWQTYHKVHSNLILYQFWNIKWLERPCWSLLLDLHLLTNMTLHHVLCNIPLHARHQNFFKSWYILVLPGCIVYLYLWASSRISLFSSASFGMMVLASPVLNISSSIK